MPTSGRSFQPRALKTASPWVSYHPWRGCFHGDQGSSREQRKGGLSAFMLWVVWTPYSVHLPSHTAEQLSPPCIFRILFILQMWNCMEFLNSSPCLLSPAPTDVRGISLCHFPPWSLMSRAPPCLPFCSFVSCVFHTEQYLQSRLLSILL